MNQMLEEPKPDDVQAPTGHFTETHGPNALDAIPTSRSCIADTIAFFSAADANMRILLMGSFGNDIDAADQLIDKARADFFVDSMLPVAASVRNRPDMKQAISSFRDARNKVKRYRDLFAHGIFARRSDLPDRVLLMKADPYRADTRNLFAQLKDIGSTGEINHDFGFRAWSARDFQCASAMAIALLNASQAMSVCFARRPEEVGVWRAELERQGLLAEPPHSAIYRREQK